MADLSHIDEARNDAVLAYRRAIEDGADVVDAVHLAADGAFELGREAGAGDMERIEREARADSFEEAAAMLLRRANEVRAGLDDEEEVSMLNNLPPRVAVAVRTRVRGPEGAMKCDRISANRIAEQLGWTIETSWISMHEGGVVVLGPWKPIKEADRGRVVH